MILLLGANGYVAESFINYFYKNEIDFEAVSRDGFDYTNFNNFIQKSFGRFQSV